MRRSLSWAGAASLAVAGSLALGAPSALARHHSRSAGSPPGYSAQTPAVATVSGDASNPAPWTLSQGDPKIGAPYDASLPTFSFGGTPLGTYSEGTYYPDVSYPNLSTDPGSNTDTAGSLLNPLPYQTGFAGTPGPLAGYCTSGGPNPETGAVAREPAGAILPMSPYYFPFVMRNPNDPRVLTGFFDYRPKDTDEALVVANSYDNGRSWHFVDEKLELNPNTCGDLIQNDNGQGHAFVLRIHGDYYLYTLNRVSGDTLGQGLLVHRLDFHPTRRDPLGDPISNLPATEPTDAGPNPVSPVQGTLGYDDVTQPAGPAVAEGSVLVPNYQTNPAGAVNIPVSSIAPFSNLTGSPGGTVVDIGPYGIAVSTKLPNVTIHCAGGSATGSSAGNGPELTGCVTVNAYGASGVQTVQVAQGDNIAAFPEVPDTAEVTDPATEGNEAGPGLQAPDGIIGTFPAREVAGAPRGSKVIVYGEKIVGYYAPATVAGSASVVLGASTGTTIPVSSLGYTGSGGQEEASLTNELAPSASNPVSGIQLGYSKSSVAGSGPGIVAVNCTGQAAASGTTPAELLGCIATNLPAGATSVTTPVGYTVGAPGACNTPGATLQLTGEGSTKATALFKNNEDYTVIRAAWTTDGINFHDLGILNGINNPAYQGNAADNTAVGATGTDLLRFVASRGTIVPTAGGRRGEETMFMSGADCQDGDSDSFEQVFYSTSTNGLDWTTPVPLIQNDPTFAASAEQEANLAKGIDSPLGVSAYYSGRVYDPNLIANPDGSLTLVFSGYRTAKPLPATGISALAIGTNPLLTYTPSATDPALYRTILTATVWPTDGRRGRRR